MDYILLSVQIIVLIVQLFLIRRQSKQKNHLDSIFVEVLYSQKNQFVAYLRLIEICNIEFSRRIEELSNGVEEAIKNENYEVIDEMQKTILEYKKRLVQLENDYKVTLRELEDFDK